jgi:hypothetical protein
MPKATSRRKTSVRRAFKNHMEPSYQPLTVD